MKIVLHQASKSLCYILLILVGSCLYIRVSLSSLTEKNVHSRNSAGPGFLGRGEKQRQCGLSFSDSVYQNLHISIQRRPSILRTIGKVIFSPKFNIYFHFPKLDISISPETWALVHFLRKLNLGRGKGAGPLRAVSTARGPPRTALAIWNLASQPLWGWSPHFQK